MRYFLLICGLFLFSGCFSFVNDDGDVKAFVIGREDTSYILKERDKVDQTQKNVIWPHKDEQSQARTQ